MPTAVDYDPFTDGYSQGLKIPGNIDLGTRPRVKNGDGYSTVRTIGINFDGKEYNIPTVSDDGRLLSNDEAIDLFRKTGRHLGAYDTPQNAAMAAERLHQDQARAYGGTPVDYDPFASGPSASDILAQQGRRAARYAFNGITGLPAILADAVGAGLNAIDKVDPLRPIESALGFKPRPALNFGSTSDYLQKNISDKISPAPTTPLERLSELGASAMGGAGLTRQLANLARNLPQAGPILSTLADAPFLQTIGAIAGGGATEAAQKAGIQNPLALGAIGMIGSVLPGSVGTFATRGARVAAEPVRPFTAGGKEVIVGDALNRLANTPTATAERLLQSEPVVPGSMPMVPAVARDTGLQRAASAIEGMDENGLIGARKSQQNSAQQAELNRISGDEATLQRATAKRDRTFAQQAQPAFDNAAPIQIGREWINNPILRTIQDIRETPAGARQTVREALDEAQSLITAEGVDLTDARVLYEIRKDLDLLRTGQLSGAGKSGRERANMRNAEQQISQVIRSIDDTIESGAPGYKDYMQMFAKRSIPLEQLKALQNLRERAVTAVPDSITQEPSLSQAKFTQLLRSNLVANPNYERAPLNGRGPGAATLRASVPSVTGKNESVLAQLTPNQIARLDRIAQDLDRNAAAQAANVKPLGSDTFKNMTVAGVIGRILGDTTAELMRETSAGKTIARPFNFLYRVPDRDIQLLMLEAWLDPQMAGRFMQRATQRNVESMANELRSRAARQAAASTLYNSAE